MSVWGLYGNQEWPLGFSGHTYTWHSLPSSPSNEIVSASCRHVGNPRVGKPQPFEFKPSGLKLKEILETCSKNTHLLIVHSIESSFLYIVT